MIGLTGAAVATAAGIGGTTVAGGLLATGSARLAGRTGGGAVKAAASLTGTIGAAYESGGVRGVARATVTAPASRAVGAVTAPVRDAFRQGAAAGYRANASPSTDGPGLGAGIGAPEPPPAPPWAQSLARRQRLTQTGLTAAQALREGDRPTASSGPELKDKS